MKLKTISLRLIELADAEFVLSLRLDERYNRFLSKVGPSLNAQMEWINKYKVDESNGQQYYFIIERLDGTPCGTVRIYDIGEDSFCWGSWILNDKKTRFAAIESALLVYEFGFDKLGFNKSHFDVMKANERVVSFHKKMGAILVKEDADNFYFEISKDMVNGAKSNILGRISNG